HQHQQAKEVGHSRVGKHLATGPRVMKPLTQRDPMAWRDSAKLAGCFRVARDNEDSGRVEWKILSKIK
ncbi:hypothetical protein NDU88_002508, partial [Pleurodeles waltl]